MKRTRWVSLGSLAFLMVAAVSAFGQETPPPDPAKQEPEPEEERIPVRWHSLSVGYSSFKTRSRLSQYARPAEGLTLHELRLVSPGTGAFPWAKLVLRGMPRQDSSIDGTLALNRGNTIVRGSRLNNSYYDQAWAAVGASDDNVTELTLDHAFSPNIGAFLYYRSDERDMQYDAPRPAEHNRSRTVGAGVQGNVLGGNLGVHVVDRRTFDDSGFQPATLQRRIEATYERQFGESFNLEGSYGYTRIEQAGLPNSGVRSYALAGGLDLAPSTSLQFHLGRQDYDLNTILNAYVRKRLTSSARLIHRWRGWSLQFGVNHRESERIRSDQTFVDVPKSNEFDARLSGRLTDFARMTLRWRWEDLTASAAMNTADPRQLLWDDRGMFQAKVDGGNEAFSAYGTYTYRTQRNSMRGVEVNWHNYAVGGSYLFNDALSGYAELSYDAFNVAGAEETGQNLDFYFPNARSVAAGLNYAADPKTSLSASLNFFESGDVRGTQLTFGLRRQLAADHDLEIFVAPWRHEDRLYNLTGYKTTLFMARYTVRF